MIFFKVTFNRVKTLPYQENSNEMVVMMMVMVMVIVMMMMKIAAKTRNMTYTMLSAYKSVLNTFFGWIPMKQKDDILFIIAKLWKQTRCPTTDEWIKKLCCIYTTEFYSAIRNNDTSFESKWMQLKDTVLSEVS
jgi:hypothetical protein